PVRASVIMTRVAALTALAVFLRVTAAGTLITTPGLLPRTRFPPTVVAATRRVIGETPLRFFDLDLARTLLRGPVAQSRSLSIEQGSAGRQLFGFLRERIGLVLRHIRFTRHRVSFHFGQRPRSDNLGQAII